MIRLSLTICYKATTQGRKPEYRPPELRACRRAGMTAAGNASVPSDQRTG